MEAECSTSGLGKEEVLRALESELRSLKQKYGKQLVLKKAKGSGPFPVTATFTANAPPSAASYDKDSLKIKIDIFDAILGRGTRDSNAQTPVQLSVVDDGIPAALGTAIVAALQSKWEETCDIARGRILQGVLEYVERGFEGLISSVPSCLEAYESVDASGATVRRFALICDTSEPTRTPIDEADPDPPDHTPSTSSTLELFPPAVQNELSMVRLRFGEENLVVSETSDPGRVRFAVTVTPSDPEWDGGALEFKGEMWGLNVGLELWLRLAPTCGLPWNTRVHVDKVLHREVCGAHGRGNALRMVLKFVEGHLCGVIKEVVDGSHEGLLDGLTMHSSDANEELGSDSESVSHESATSGSDAQPHEFHGEGNVQRGEDSYDVLLEGLKFDNLDIIEGLQLVFQTACSRCKDVGSITLASPSIHQDTQNSGGVWRASGACSNCHQDWGLDLTPRMVHERSNCLAWLKPHNCILVDLLPSHFMVQCVCGSVTSIRDVQIGKRSEKKCRKCCHGMIIHYETVSFVLRSHAAPSQSNQRQKKAVEKGREVGGGNMGGHFQGPLVLGQCLPDRGTCKHYRHSHRWLRFPCCGMRFPCDLCHEELTDGHSMKWAYRMVCGYCSLEQPVAEACKSCEKKLAGSAANPLGRSTRFWEGGQGCRDKRRMDRREAKKYRNSKFKTKSNKANRVGVKGADKRKN